MSNMPKDQEKVLPRLNRSRTQNLWTGAMQQHPQLAQTGPSATAIVCVCSSRSCAHKQEARQGFHEP